MSNRKKNGKGAAGAATESADTPAKFVKLCVRCKNNLDEIGEAKYQPFAHGDRQCQKCHEKDVREIREWEAKYADAPKARRRKG